MKIHSFLPLLLAGVLVAPAIDGDPATERTPDVDATISGRVLDGTTGRPLQGTQVVVEGTSFGALTNADGRYLVALYGEGWTGREVTLRFTLVGFEEVRRTVVLSAGTTVADASMTPASIGLDEIVVTGATAGKADARQGDLAAPAMPLARSRAVAEQAVPPTVSLPAHPGPGGLPGRYNPNFHTESYARVVENPFLAVGANPLSTFSIDVDRASYANVRRMIREGVRPPVDAVRIEELVNYFTYDLPEPAGGVPFSVTTEVAPAPWQPLHRLVRIGLQGRSVDMEGAPPSNLVFLVDVSGSMQPPNKLPLLKTALRMLVDQLRPRDRVAIVVYAGAAGLALPSTSGEEKDRILDALASLEAGGSTAGGAGIRLAYDVAARNHVPGGNNRVILATDGDFNVGASSDAEMVRLIEEKREQGTFLTVLGFGTGNLKDSKMEALADHGNGNFAYIDSPLEARKVLVAEMGGTLLTIAKDVKLQVEFNPTRVAAYRLIGYENRLLAAEDFDDDRKDAGEMGAGHTVTALYEVIPRGVRSPVEVRGLDDLRYQSTTIRERADDSPELLYVKLRYKEPTGRTSRLLDHPVVDGSTRPSDDFRFASAVAAWGMLLRESRYVGEFTMADVGRLARGALGEDQEGYRGEFLQLVDATRRLELVAERDGGR